MLAASLAFKKNMNPRFKEGPCLKVVRPDDEDTFLWPLLPCVGICTHTRKHGKVFKSSQVWWFPVLEANLVY